MDSSPNIHIGIIKAKRIAFELFGKFECAGRRERFYGSCTASVQNGGIRIINNEKKTDIRKEMIFLPSNLSADLFEIKNVIIGVDFHWERKENQKFQGALKLKFSDNEIQVINICPVENYLYSVISSEMNANSSLNLLKSHAVISRSWIMSQVKPRIELGKQKEEKITNKEEILTWFDREDHKDFHVCADDHCQRYQGITRAHHRNVIKAVQETFGQVLLHEGTICDTRYSKCCGGVSELYENCWEPEPKKYLQKLIDAPEENDLEFGDLRVDENAEQYINLKPAVFCHSDDRKVLQQVLNDYDLESSEYFRWEVKYNQKELSGIINLRSGIDFGEIIDLIPVERGVSGRIIKLKIVGTKKHITIGKELIIRKWLSKSHLYSSAFYLEKKDVKEGVPQEFILKGAGWGHGVGLCQIGAAVMGEKGYDYKDILSHYYKNVSIEKIYS